MRTIAILLFAVPLAAQSTQPEKEKLERIRKMSPEERRRLLERLDQLKNLDEEEKQRLKENLGRFRQLPPEAQEDLKKRVGGLPEEKRKLYRELAGGFFKTLARRNPREVRAFPRMLFFQWMNREHQSEVDRVQSLGADERSRAFTDLYHQFRADVLARTLQHAEKKGCFDLEKAKSLREVGDEFWTRWRELLERCPHRPKPPQRPKPDHR